MAYLGNGYFGGWKRQPADPKDFKYTLREISSAPQKANILNLMPSVFDQGQIGSCTANAGVAALMSLDKKEGLAAKMWSRLFLYFNERKEDGTTRQDAGANIRDVFKAANKYGVCDEIIYPYNERSIFKTPPVKAYKSAFEKPTTYELLPQSVASVKDCIASGFSVIFGFDVYESFMNIGSDGLMPLPTATERIIGGHAVCVVGYDDTKKLLTVRNSWGSSWGDKGHFYMPYSFFESNSCSDSWTVKKTASQLTEELASNSTFTIAEGNHFSNPRNFPISKFKPLTFEFSPNESWKYLLKDATQPSGLSVDQLDWNKLLGVTVTPLNPMGDTVMSGWRYEPDTDSITICPYWHRNSFGIVREMDESLKVPVKIGTTYQVSLWHDGTNMHYVMKEKSSGNVLQVESKPFRGGWSFLKLCHIIQPYFGGNKVAVQNTYFDVVSI